MSQQKYIVRLSAAERAELKNIVKKGGGSAFRIRHAQILLHSDATVGRQSAAAIATMLQCSGKHGVRGEQAAGGTRVFSGAVTQKALCPGHATIV